MIASASCIYSGLVIACRSRNDCMCGVALNMQQCYFLLSVSPAAPIIYQVVRVRDGRSYVTRTVSAVQRGRTVFVMLCSFQRPELGQPVHQWPMPPNVPRPEECEEVQEYYERMLLRKDLDPRLRAYAEEYIQVSISHVGEVYLTPFVCYRNAERVPWE